MVFNYLLVFSCLFGRALMANIPSYINVCHRNDPKITECIIKSMELLKPQLKQGIPELNVPSIEPLPLNEIKLRSGPSQAQLNADITKLKVWDVGLFQITDLKYNIEKRLFDVKIQFPHLYFESDYIVDMNVLVIKYKGKGIMKGNFTDYKMDFNLKYDIITKNGGKYMNFPKVGVRIHQGKSTVQLTGLFKNDPALGKTVAQVIRDNSDLFINEVLPVLEESLSNRLTEIANDITNTFLYDDIFPE